jgi:ubiquinone/menaquinone biosynthesis C-methylase UbiE
MTISENGWWNDFFEPFRIFFYTVPQDETNAQVRYLVKKLNLKPGRKFLDCPCGIGRVAVPLAKRGIAVTGVDITQSYLDELEQRSLKLGLNIKLVRKDMRRISFNSEFDAVGNIWSSFGFFDTEAENQLVLKKMFKALKPGGKLVLHLFNRDNILKDFQTHRWFQVKNVKILEEREFNYRTSIMHTIWHFMAGGEQQTSYFDIREYSYHELVSMFESVGFTDVQGYSSIKDEPIDPEKRRIYIFGTKPGT